MSYDLPWESATGERAACIADHAPFDAYASGFPSKYMPTYAAACKAICDGCPVLAQCRAAVMRDEAGLPIAGRDGYVAGMTPHQRFTTDQGDGIWGGTTTRDRQNTRRRNKRAEAAS